MSAAPHARQDRFSRRTFLQASMVAGATAALNACSPVQPVADPSTESLRRPGIAASLRQGEQVELVYQDWSTEWFPGMVQEMLEEFHAAHPNIHVFYVPDPENVNDRMLADMQAGSAPDVFQGCCQYLPTWAQKGYALDLRPYVAADLDAATIEDWDPAQYRALFLRDGPQFGLPKYHGALALYYNKDLFDLYNVDYPDDTWDHDDYLSAMQRLTRGRRNRYQTDLWGSTIDVSWDRIQVHVNGWGGHFVDPDDPTHCLMSDPKALAAMDWLQKRIWSDRVMPSRMDARNLNTRQAFATGRTAMAEEGSWALKEILSQADFRVGVAPFPAGPEQRVTLASTDGFGIYSGTKHPEAAWELLKFLISKDYGRAMARANFLQPARLSLVEDWIGYVREEYPEKAKDLDIAAFAHGHLHGYSVTAEIFQNMNDAWQLAYDAWDRVFTFGDVPVTRMVDVCQQIDAAQRQE